MELSCLADAFNIRKRKQFWKKDADLASSSLWGRKEEEGEMVKSFCLFFRWRQDRGGSTGWCLRTVLLMLLAVIGRGKSPFLALSAGLYSLGSPFYCPQAAGRVLQCYVEHQGELHRLHVVLRSTEK